METLCGYPAFQYWPLPLFVGEQVTLRPFVSVVFAPSCDFLQNCPALTEPLGFVEDPDVLVGVVVFVGVVEVVDVVFVDVAAAAAPTPPAMAIARLAASGASLRNVIWIS